MSSHEFNNTSGEANTGKPVPPSESGASQMPLSMLTGDGEDGMDVDFGMKTLAFTQQRKSPVTGGAMVLIVLLAVGGGTLWAMRMTNNVGESNATAKAASQKIDDALKRLTGADAAQADALSAESINDLFKDADQVVAMFANDPVEKQVPLEALAKDPFELHVARKVETVVEPDNDALAEKRRQERIVRLEKELSGMKLQSVLTGAQSLAVISGNIVRQGDTIGSFSIETINASGIVMTAEGEKFTLTMPIPGGSK